MAIDKVAEYINDGYEWIIDLDIEKFFDTVNHDKLIQVLRLEVNDSTTLNLIRKYLKAGVMENGIFTQTKIGTPQGGPISPVLSNILLDQFDEESIYKVAHSGYGPYKRASLNVCNFIFTPKSIRNN